MVQQIPVPDEALAPDLYDHGIHIVADDLAYQRLAIVNVAFVGPPHAGDRGWTLIDAGLPGTASVITRAAHARFGPASRPNAIVLTHGHFDHVGVLRTLADAWDCPVYAHRLERPYLDGTKSYPAPDPAVGGLVALLAPLFPRGPISIADRLIDLPDDQSVPALPGFRWIHTPGHTPGHVSFFRDRDRALLAGDAVITTAQESAYAVAVQSPEVHGPPRYFTADWTSAAESVRALNVLAPELVITGHGRAMHGPALREALNDLATNFERVAIPAGRQT